MEIEIWSDIMCPFCYLGKARLEKALESFSGSGGPQEVETFAMALERAASES